MQIPLICNASPQFSRLVMHFLQYMTATGGITLRAFASMDKETGFQDRKVLWMRSNFVHLWGKRLFLASLVPLKPVLARQLHFDWNL